MFMISAKVRDMNKIYLKSILLACSKVKIHLENTTNQQIKDLVKDLIRVGRI